MSRLTVVSYPGLEVETVQFTELGPPSRADLWSDVFHLRNMYYHDKGKDRRHVAMEFTITSVSLTPIHYFPFFFFLLHGRSYPLNHILSPNVAHFLHNSKLGSSPVNKAILHEACHHRCNFALYPIRRDNAAGRGIICNGLTCQPWTMDSVLASGVAADVLGRGCQSRRSEEGAWARCVPEGFSFR